MTDPVTYEYFVTDGLGAKVGPYQELDIAGFAADRMNCVGHDLYMIELIAHGQSDSKCLFSMIPIGYRREFARIRARSYGIAV